MEEHMTIGSAVLGLGEDDLSARPPRAAVRQEAKQAHITCRVCDRPATVGIDHPALLCLECMADLDATRDHVQAWLSAALSALDTNQQAWETTRLASPAHD